MCDLVNGLHAVVEFCRLVYVGCADPDGEEISLMQLGLRIKIKAYRHVADIPSNRLMLYVNSLQKYFDVMRFKLIEISPMHSFTDVSVSDNFRRG